METPKLLKKKSNIIVPLSAVHPHACPLWSLPLYGCGLAQWSTGESVKIAIHVPENSYHPHLKFPKSLMTKFQSIRYFLLIQFMDRLKLLLMPAKHQPDLIYLRHVPLRKVHLFTFVQLLCLALLWILKSTVAAIIFPVMVSS